MRHMWHLRHLGRRPGRGGQPLGQLVGRPGFPALLLVGGLASAVGCASDTPAAPGGLRDAATAYWALAANHEAVTLSTVAPYDTIRLAPVPLNGAGAALPAAVADSAVTTYSLADPTDSSVTVTAQGLVQARYPSERSAVVVRTTLQAITRVDTVPVHVTTEVAPPTVAALQIAVTPSPVITPTLFVPFPQTTITVRAVDADGQEIPGVAVRLAVRDAALARVVSYNDGRPPELTYARNPILTPRQTMLVARATVYGTPITDSVPVTLTRSSTALLQVVFTTPRSATTPVGHFEPVVDTVQFYTDPFFGPGATLAVRNLTAQPIDVVFDSLDGHPIEPGVVGPSLIELIVCGTSSGGDIPEVKLDPASACPWDQQGGKFRTLTAPGTYHYHSEAYGTGGTIVVLPPVP